MAMKLPSTVLTKLVSSYNHLWKPPPKKPPYNHICRIGDPVLRYEAKAIDVEKIKSEEIQKVISKMKKVMRNHKAVGLAAPQIGCSLRVITMEFSPESLEMFPPSIVLSREYQAFPLQATGGGTHLWTYRLSSSVRLFIIGVNLFHLILPLFLLNMPNLLGSTRILTAFFLHLILPYFSMPLLQNQLGLIRLLDIISQVFVNPVMRVVEKHKVTFPEACECIKGYSALVPRYYEVKITGYNEKAEEVEWQVKGWPARIIQHELDHINGKLYTDIMVSQSFQYDFWYQEHLQKWFNIFIRK
ncbi:peptide deformylase, mitochondrial-like isoform X1 [Limulus polyphemus]|uniref:Peptide deformylase n=1 Tax=Limulus polyphemus TaxID=6850 RepID=A0ABM1SY05_LIMPO|nr:peptide deformylase, mitochondrial-like isoform X1 [Limulus polyphemus]